MSKALKQRVANAFRAMKSIGISEDKVKPVLKNLLKLFDKNWELIEEENYRALADAIFEREEAVAAEHAAKVVNNESSVFCQAADHSKKNVDSENENSSEEETQVPEEPERPLKRLRLRYQEGPTSSTNLSNSNVSGTPLIKPKEEPDVLPETRSLNVKQSQGMVESSHPNAGDTRVRSQGAMCQSLNKNKGKQPVSPKSLTTHEGCDPYQPSNFHRSQQNTPLRIESSSPSHSLQLRDRGKGPLSSQIHEKGSGPKLSSHAVHHKEPNVEPEIINSLKRKSATSHALIKPKDEPITDDMPQQEVPMAVTHPDQPDGVLLSRVGRIRENGVSNLPSALPIGENDAADGTSAPYEPANNGELAVTLNKCSSVLEITSSSLGEVKLSLSCHLPLGRPDFHMPSLEALLKSVEDKCLRSYKTLDPNFSVMNLMQEMCECCLKLGTESSNESPETIDVTPTIDLLKKTSATNALGAKGLCFSSLNRVVNSHTDAQFILPQTIMVPPSCDNDGDGSQPNKTNWGEGRGTNRENQENSVEDANSLSLMVVDQCELTPEKIRSLHDVIDISKGQEKVVITLVNEVNNECPPSFYYIPQNAVFQSACVKFALSRIGDNNCCSTCFGDCLSLSAPCACGHETGGVFAYSSDGLVKENFLKECISVNRDQKKHRKLFCKECPLERSKNEDLIEPCKGHLLRTFIKECWWKCGCSKQCGNRVVQRGISCNLQVFMTPEGKGWGLRTLEDLPKGAFVCEYVGEVLTNSEFFDRVSRSCEGEKHSYSVLLDADWGSKGALKSEEALCLDATYYGNVGRFINHRCYDSNLVEIPVEVETPDHHYYHLAFFTTRKVNAMEELTRDYGIEFDDNDFPIKAFSCLCGSNLCRNIKHFTRSRSASRR